MLEYPMTEVSAAREYVLESNRERVRIYIEVE